MEAFDLLSDVLDNLLGPNGCPWDREQTLKSLRKYMLEEVSEVIEAIDSEDSQKIKDELGDFFFNALFAMKVAEKELHCKAEEVLQHVREKLIRRHPHVFGDTKLETSDEVIHQWEKIKKGEKASAHHKSSIDGISKALPSLIRAQKLLKKFKKAHFDFTTLKAKEDEELKLGLELLHLIQNTEKKKLDAEGSLRKTLFCLEKDFREWEKTHD